MFLICAEKKKTIYTHIKPKEYLVKGIEDEDGAVYSITKTGKN